MLLIDACQWEKVFGGIWRQQAMSEMQLIVQGLDPFSSSLHGSKK